MRTGLSYMGHHNPKHIKNDLEDIKSLGCDDVFLAIQENDFNYFDGKIKFFPKIALDLGIKPIAIFWGLLNYFGGGKSSQFLLDNPLAHQVAKDGSYKANGCYNNDKAIVYIKSLIDNIAREGFKGYFIDEPSIIHCYCESCQDLYGSMHQGDIFKATKEEEIFFRKECIVRYICLLADYIRINHPDMETSCCIMPCDQEIWPGIACIDSLDSLGTDIYWVNNDKDLNQMRPLIKQIKKLCKDKKKANHQWLQCWGVEKGKESRITESGNILIEENPDALYVWAYNAQLGTTEACYDPRIAWAKASEILKKAKNI